MIKKLNSFSKSEREVTLRALAASLKHNKRSDNVNMHIHSFFSYNAQDWSPSRVAYECTKRGLYAAGIIDFDVIDGMTEFLNAGELLGLRTSVGIETRAFSTKMADKEIDSPGEPGVSYIAAAGFSKELTEDSELKRKLDHFRKTADDRNVALINRINANVNAINIDYNRDVLPLTPSGNATERHIIKAYIIKADRVFAARNELLNFWVSILGKSDNDVSELLNNRPKMEDVVRSKFAKKGGFGYHQPTEDSFPKVEDFFAWARSCDAIPMESWLDGTSDGETNPNILLELAVVNGAEALNIIPDRNWNIADVKMKKLKIKNIYSIIEAAKRLNLPLHIGTEMNKAGQPFADDLDGPVLKNFKEDFMTGAKIFVGHTILTRFADFSYVGENANSEFGNNKALKNIVFAKVGALPPVTIAIGDKLRSMVPEKAFAYIRNSAEKGVWGG